MIPTSSFIIPTSALLAVRLSKQMKQRLESVPEHRRTIAEERITRLMQRSFQEGEKLERIEALVALVLDALELDEYRTVCQHVHKAEKVDVFHFATALEDHTTPCEPKTAASRRRMVAKGEKKRECAALFLCNTLVLPRLLMHPRHLIEAQSQVALSNGEFQTV